MSRYPLWKYILVILLMVYAVIYTLPNFYESYPSINVTNYENRDLSKVELTKLIEDKSIPYMGVDGRSIFFKSIDDQLSAYNKLSSDQKFKYTLSNYNHIPKWLHAINAQPVSLGLDLKGGVHFLLQIDTDNVRKSRANQLESNLRNFLIDNGIRYSNVINDNSEVKFVLINKFDLLREYKYSLWQTNTLIFFLIAILAGIANEYTEWLIICLLYTSPSPRDLSTSRMPCSA